jgi:hypothetical protein
MQSNLFFVFLISVINDRYNRIQYKFVRLANDFDRYNCNLQPTIYVTTDNIRTSQEDICSWNQLINRIQRFQISFPRLPGLKFKLTQHRQRERKKVCAWFWLQVLTSCIVVTNAIGKDKMDDAYR